MVQFCYYNKEKHFESTKRVWLEVGWYSPGENFEQLMEVRALRGAAHVAEINGDVECMVLTAPGTIRYLDEELPFSGVMAVVTSRIARKQGIAGRLAARAIAIDAAEGALVTGLGIFDQGFYDLFGFGTGGYEHFVSFDPAQLDIPVKARIPRRITEEHWKEAHASRLARRRGHGSVSFDRPEVTRSGLMWKSEQFALGYFDGPNGELTHHIVGEATGERGPYKIFWLSYQTHAQFLELMALLHNLGDQVRLMTMMEPPGIQLQDLVRQPFRWRQLTEHSPYQNQIRSVAEWQMRILDLEECLERTHLAGEPVRFNLQLTDPIDRFLEDDAPWKGIDGEYVVALGPSSGAERGVDPTLPTLSASVGAFTRLWLGVRPATGLATTDSLAAPDGLLARLDRCIRLPEPKPDWSF